MLSRVAWRRSLATAAVVVGWELHSDASERRQLGHQQSSRPAVLNITGPALCDAKKPALQLPKKIATPEPEYHAVPLPSDALAKLKDITTRFKAYAGGKLDEVGKFKKEKGDVKIFTIKGGSIPDPNGKTGLPFSRIGETILKAPAEDIAELWWVFNSRKDWDPGNTTASEMVEDYGQTRLVYIKAAAKPMISPRDFSFLSHKVPPSELGGRIGSYAFIQVDAADALPANSGAVRASINSALLVEPIDAFTTRVRYLVEIDPKGWLPSLAVEAAADDLPGCLAAMKKHFEAQAGDRAR